MAQYFWRIQKVHNGNVKVGGNTPHPDVLRVQAVLAPCWRYAAVEVRSRATHVQLVLIGLRRDIISHVGASKQELMEGGKIGQHWLFPLHFLSKEKQTMQKSQYTYIAYLLNLTLFKKMETVL